jgi:hypothetical protein
MTTHYESSLPVRSEADGASARVHVKMVDYTDPDTAGNQAQISDGNVHTYVHGQNPAGTEEMLRTSELGAPVIDGLYDATNNTDPSNMGLVGMVRNATPDETQQTLRLTGKANAAGDVRALDVALHSSNGEAISNTNPIPVYITGEVAGTDVLERFTTADLASGSPTTFNYTVPSGFVFTLQKVSASASGRIIVQIKLGTTASEVIKKDLFNSTAFPNVEYEFSRPQNMADTQSVKVTIENCDKGANDVFATIEGYLTAV